MRPVFIGGALRSGTTMLADLLGCHPQISPIYETDFVIDLLQLVFVDGRDAATPDRIRTTMQRFLERVPHMGTKKRPYERYVHGNSHLRFDPAVVALQTERLLEERERDGLPAFRRFFEALFAHHAASDGKPSWVNKTPANLHFAPGLRAVFDDMLLVHVVRDGRDVAASAVQMSFGPRTVRDAARWWVAAMEFAEDFSHSHPDQFLEIRYEDLVHDLEPTIAAVCSAMGQTMPSDLVPGWALATGGPDPRRTGMWEEVFTTRDRNDFVSIAGATLEKHGYEVALPV